MSLPALRASWSEIADAPTVLQVELTSVCNLRCLTCPLSVGGTATSQAPSPMSEVIWAMILLSCAHRQVIISGFGEPLTDRNFLKRIQELGDRGATVSFSTNALLATPEMSAAIATCVAVKHVNVSMDAGDAETYQAVRGGDFTRMIKGLHSLHAALGDRLSVSVVATTPVIRNAGALIAALTDAGRPRTVVQPYKNFRADAGLALPREDAHAVDGLKNDLTAASIPAFIQASPISWTEADPNGRDCMLPWSHPYIDKDGSVHSCCDAAATGHAPLGNIRDATLADVWNGPAYKAFRRGLTSGELPAPCRTCTIVPHTRHTLTKLVAGVAAVSIRDGLLRIQVVNLGSDVWSIPTASSSPIPGRDGRRRSTTRPGPPGKSRLPLKKRRFSLEERRILRSDSVHAQANSTMSVW